MSIPPTASPAHARGGARPLGPVGLAAHTHIKPLQQGYRNNNSSATATLAALRRGAGKPVGSLPELWGMTGMEQLDEEALKGIDVERAEAALHLAVPLWALHQQSKRNASMHAWGKAGLPGSGPQLGAAVRRLMPPDELDEALRRRFVRAGNAHDIDGLTVRLREIILLLRARDQPLDYGRLAEQLYLWQAPAARDAVRRAWGRSFQLTGIRQKQKTGSGDDTTDTTDKDVSA